MNNPLISIIVPVYKVEKYLSLCINSIINQTYKNLEILLIDDGSPDNCGKICEEFAKMDNRISVIHKENGGLSDARNVGLDNCKGDYIAFVDSDDEINEKYIEKLYKLISSGNYQVAQIGTQFIDEKDKKVHGGFVYGSGISVLKKDKFIRNLLLGKISWAVWCNLYVKKFFEGVRFKKNEENEDSLMWLNGVEKINKVIISDEKLYNYRQRANSITSNNNVSFFTDQLEHSILWLKKIQKYYPYFIDEAYYYVGINLIAFFKVNGNNMSSKIYVKYLRKNIRIFLHNPFLTHKNKFMLLTVFVYPRLFLNMYLFVSCHHK